MAPPRSGSDLVTLARRLVKDGPVKTLPTPRRVRLIAGGACIADTLGTTGALYVWEHEYYPQYYLPRDALIEKPKGYQITFKEHEAVTDDDNHTIATTLDVKIQPQAVQGANGAVTDSDDHSRTRDITDGFVVFSQDLSGKAKDLRNMVKVRFDAVDQWFEEDTPIFVHPKDPFKRVDILTSTRGLKIAIDGHEVAHTPTSTHLYETSLPVRYYMPLTAIDTSILRPSTTRTQCPYKGEAEYYDVSIGSKTYKDIVWFYTHPTVECAAVAGLCCFYNEKVDISIKNGDDWEKLEQPSTHFA